MSNHKLLLVEDEAVISMYIEETLNALGYSNIQKAYDASTALAYLLNEQFDMVLMDINLGGEDGKDGIDVMNEIKKDKDLPFIYITGNSDQKTVDKAKYSRPDGFIVKPFNQADLRITMELILHKLENKLPKAENINNKSVSLSADALENLVIRVGPNGEIYYVNSPIKNITDKPSLYYSGKNIENADFDADFASTLTNILEQVKNTKRRLFYLDVKTKKSENIIMEVTATPDNFSNKEFESCLLSFKDITHRVDIDSLFEKRQYITKQKTASSILKLITPREKEVLSHVKDGLNNNQIAAILNMSPKTVSVHRTHLMKKLKVKNVAELVKIVIENNVVFANKSKKE